ncbi:serine/threonine-protein kinase [Agrococcus casei]|uniref:serine/threonine-protein kinase n=1 Tax=Agrococcus casei TaxID=343512 RepID=UPI003F8DF94E
MSPKRAPAPPPEIPGYDFIQLLGSGGFADVYLYQQALPSRRVAIKVLLQSQVNQNAIENFRNEANLMAQLSEHPSIVTIYGAAVTPDGRPYLAMEYAPKANLGQRYQRERFSVPEVLTLGVQIAGAVETAHRAGILHRDIKPANILVTAYNRPALTDFGIATSGTVSDQETGMSVPWSPPEAFASQPWAGPESDVFSLAATLYTLLAGRTPFEMPGESNSSLDLIERIEAGAVAPLARSDVPPELENALRIAMEADVRKRYSSSLDLGRALQRVESSMALPVTQIDVLDDAVAQGDMEEEDGGATRIRGVVTIDAQHAPQPPLAGPSAVVQSNVPQAVDDKTVIRAQVFDQAAPQQQAEPQAPASTPEERKRSRKLWIPLSIAAAFVVIAVIVIAILIPSGEAIDGNPSEPPPPPPPAAPQLPTGFTVVEEGDDVTFAWVNPQPADGDRYRYRYEQTGENPVTDWLDEPQVTVPKDSRGTTCIYVQIVRETGQTSQYAEQCSDEQ